MANPYKGQTDDSMSPSDLGWHFEYAMARLTIISELQKLQAHPSFKDAEGLGDYVEGMGTVLSFMPPTRKDIHEAALISRNKVRIMP